MLVAVFVAVAVDVLAGAVPVDVVVSLVVVGAARFVTDAKVELVALTVEDTAEVVPATTVVSKPPVEDVEVPVCGVVVDELDVGCGVLVLVVPVEGTDDVGCGELVAGGVLVGDGAVLLGAVDC